MKTRKKTLLIGQGTDALTILIYLALITIGWFSIYAAVYDPAKPWFAFSLNYTKQLMWIGTAFILIVFILTFDYRNYETFAYLLYGGMLVLLVLVLLVGKEINGNQSWLDFGFMRLQPSEFAKFITALALSKFLVSPGEKAESLRTRLMAGAILAVPVLVILLQKDVGSALVFSSFAFVLYRERILPDWMLFGGILMGVLFILGLYLKPQSIFYFLVIPILTISVAIILYIKEKKPSILITVLGVSVLLIGYIYSTKYIFENFLAQHHQERILVLLKNDIDPQGRGVRYNLFHSKVAIGSGGFSGKGFLNGTQTKLNYVPEQSTDFIFCTVGEEYGWLGSLAVIGLYLALIIRLIFLAERQRDRFARIYGYSVASILFFHFAINIAMTIGLFPVVGIPLPFLSYGGSSLWSFTILLFIFLKLDAHHEQQMERK